MAEVKRLYEAGLTLGEIATEVGIGATTVTNYITEMRLANRREGKRRIGPNPVHAVSRLVHQLDHQADILAGLLDDIRYQDIPVPQDTLATWDDLLNRRDNITAVLSRLRNLIKERSNSNGIASSTQG